MRSSRFVPKLHGPDDPFLPAMLERALMGRCTALSVFTDPYDATRMTTRCDGQGHLVGWYFLRLGRKGAVQRAAIERSLDARYRNR